MDNLITYSSSVMFGGPFMQPYRACASTSIQNTYTRPDVTLHEATPYAKQNNRKRRAEINLGSTDMAVPALDFKSHAAEPIKSVDDINKIYNFLEGGHKYKDLCLFVMGINFGLRIGDLLSLRYGDIIKPNLEFRDPIWIREQKTKKPRALYVNDAVESAFRLYCGSRRINLDEYMFDGYSGNPMTRQNVDKKFKRYINQLLGMNIHVSTHFLRKTFAYHFILSAKDRSRAVEYLQKAFNHSSAAITLMYAGITDDEIRDMYLGLNLGSGSIFATDPNVIFTYQYDDKVCDIIELSNDDRE